MGAKYDDYNLVLVVDNVHQSVRFVQIISWWSSNLRH